MADRQQGLLCALTRLSELLIQPSLTAEPMDILLKGAVAMLWASLALAWVAAFSRLIILRPVQIRIKDPELSPKLTSIYC